MNIKQIEALKENFHLLEDMDSQKYKKIPFMEKLRFYSFLNPSRMKDKTPYWYAHDVFLRVKKLPHLRGYILLTNEEII